MHDAKIAFTLIFFFFSLNEEIKLGRWRFSTLTDMVFEVHDIYYISIVYLKEIHINRRTVHPRKWEKLYIGSLPYCFFLLQISLYISKLEKKIINLSTKKALG